MVKYSNEIYWKYFWSISVMYNMTSFLYSIDKVVILTTKSLIVSKYYFLWRYLKSHTYLESAFQVLQNELSCLIENLYFIEKVPWCIGRISYLSQSRDLSTDNQFKTWIVHSSSLHWLVWAQWRDFFIIWPRKII